MGGPGAVQPTRIDWVDLRKLSVNGVQVRATANEINQLAGAGVTAADLQLLHQLVFSPGKVAVGVIDVNTGAAEAGCKVVIDGVDYQEDDDEDLPNGVWTNGASAEDSVDSLVAAINGDTRLTKPPVTAIKVGTHSIVLCANVVGWEAQVTTDSAGNITVEDITGGAPPGLQWAAHINRIVTAQDVLAGEVWIPLRFTPDAWVATVYAADGSISAPSGELTYEAGPPRRLVYAIDGASKLIEGDVIHLIAMG